VQTRTQIAELQRRLKVTTVYVTHDQVEAMTMGERVAVLRAGQLQQFDSPTELYDHPENVFVAGFIGTPPMNLLECSVSVNGGVSIDLGGNAVPIAEQALANYPGLRGYHGRKAIVGLRAGDLHPMQDRGELPSINARVQLVESLGGESMAYFKVDAHSFKSEAAEEEEILESESGDTVVGARPNLVASFPPHVQLQLGSDVPVAIDTQNLHFFDEASGAPLR
jgi:multiple sugar transport system ATP-binding protein